VIPFTVDNLNFFYANLLFGEKKMQEEHMRKP